MTILFHAGTTKTGTTALQHFLKNNRAALEDKGCVFPSFLGPDNHTRLAAYGMDTDAMAPVKIDLKLTEPAAIEAFRKEVDKQFKEHIRPGKKYVLSNEHCSAHLHTGPEITRLHKLLTSTGHTVKVIIYFREPSEYLASSYSTLLKQGFSHEMMCPVGRALDRKYNYYAICKRWARVFGKENIIARVYARDALEGGDIRKDFLKLIGVEEEGLDFTDRGAAISNKSLDHVMAGFLREVNKQVPRYIDNKINPLRADLGALCEQLSTKEGILVPKAISSALRESLLEDLKEFNRRYLGGPLKWPFKPYKQASRKLVRAPNRDEVLELYAKVWQAKIAQLRGEPLATKTAPRQVKVVSGPETKKPEAATSQHKKTAATAPVQRKPGAPGPQAQKPAASGPQQGKPGTTAPQQQKPNATGTQQGKQAAGAQQSNKPAAAGPQQQKPVEAGPQQSKPAAAVAPQGKPTASGPQQGKPAPSGPAQNKPAASGPQQGKPAAVVSQQLKQAAAGAQQNKPAAPEPQSQKAVPETPQPKNPVASGPKLDRPAVWGQQINKAGATGGQASKAASAPSDNKKKTEGSSQEAKKPAAATPRASGTRAS